MPRMLRVTELWVRDCWRQSSGSCCWRRCCWVWPTWCWTQRRRATWCWPPGSRAAMSPSSARACLSLRPVGIAAPRPVRGQRPACRRRWSAVPKPRQCGLEVQRPLSRASVGPPGSDCPLTGNEFRRADDRSGSTGAAHADGFTAEQPSSTRGTRYARQGCRHVIADVSCRVRFDTDRHLLQRRAEECHSTARQRACRAFRLCRAAC